MLFVNSQFLTGISCYSVHAILAVTIMEPVNTPPQSSQPLNNPPVTPPADTAGNDTYVMAISGFGLFGKGAFANKLTDKPVALVLFASGKIIAINGHGEVTEEFKASSVAMTENKGLLRVAGDKLTVEGQPRVFVSDAFMRSAKEAKQILAEKHPEYQFSAACEAGLVFFTFVEAFNKDPAASVAGVKNIKPEDLTPDKTNPSSIYKDTGLDVSVFGMLFSPEKKGRAIAMAIVGVPLLLLMSLLFYTGTKDTADLTKMTAYDLTVKNTKVDSGFRESSNLLIYTKPPIGIICQNIVVQTPLKVYPDEAARPKAGDSLRVYLPPDAECSSNGLFMSGYTEKTTTENAMDSIVNISLIGASLFGAGILLFGVFYASNKQVREFYLSHAIIGKLIAILIFGWMIVGYGMRFFDLSSLGLSGFIIPVILAAIFYFISRGRR